ncbi:MAG TPA: hypothetical protein DIC36_00995 [Gammaproteobacteria bacterium]|nr:hypothetical protein [Gammaproteobacteria bacterium]
MDFKKIVHFILLALYVFSASSRAEIITGPGSLNQATVGTFGEVLTGEMVSDVSLSFSKELNTSYDVTTTVTGDGAAVLSGQSAQVSSTTGTARIASRKSIRYRAGHTGIIRFTASFEGTGTGYAGAFDSGSGFLIKRAANLTTFCYRKTTDTCTGLVDSTASGYTPRAIDWSKLNIFEIQYGYLGVANPALFVYTDKGRENIAVIYTQNRLTDAHSGKPKFPMAVETSGAMKVRTASWQGGTIGPSFMPGSGRPFHIAMNGGTLSAASLKTIANFKCSSTLAEGLEATESRLLYYTFFVDSPSGNNVGTVEFRIYRNATLSGTPSYSNVSSASLMQYDTTATYSSGGIHSSTTWVDWTGSVKGGSADGVINDADKSGLACRADDVFTITAQNVGLATDNVRVRLAFSWEEF